MTHKADHRSGLLHRNARPSIEWIVITGIRTMGGIMDEQSGTATNTLVKILGTPGSATAYAIRDFLHRSDVPFEWVQLSSDEQARAQAGVDHLRDPRLPVC